MTTPRLGAPELTSGQATPETTVNEQIRYIESGAGHFIFKDRDLSTPPGSPADGDCYLVKATGSGAWTGHSGNIAFYVNTAWVFIAAIEGFTAWVDDEDVFIGFDGAAWNTLASPSGVYQPLDADLTAIAGLTPAQGDIIYHNGTQWTNLAAGTSGQFLKTQGAGANPAWADTASNVTVKDEGVNLTTALTSMDFVGAGVTATNVGGAVTVTISGGAGGGSAWNLQAGPLLNEAPASAFATLDSRNGHPVLDFDDTTAESAVWTFVLPNDYSGAGVTVTIYWTATSATSGNVMWQASFEAMSGQDIDSDSFATAQAFAASACNATSGIPTKVSLNVSDGANMDSAAAGTQFRLKITRDASNASDTMTGDAELLRVMVVSQ